jgi:hypothetical protein
VTIPRPAERKRQAALDAEAAVQKVMGDLHATLSLMRNWIKDLYVDSRPIILEESRDELRVYNFLVVRLKLFFFFLCLNILSSFKIKL